MKEGEEIERGDGVCSLKKKKKKGGRPVKQQEGGHGGRAGHIRKQLLTRNR